VRAGEVATAMVAMILNGLSFSHHRLSLALLGAQAPHVHIHLPSRRVFKQSCPRAHEDTAKQFWCLVRLA
jgi:hypothetical protein